MTIEKVIQECKVIGEHVKLPSVQLDRKIYVEVKKKLEGIGGKWKGGKISAFVFPSDPTELLSSIQSGEKINLKKDFQFFGTPSDLADRLVNLAEIEPFGDIVLEPSAGQGAIIEAIKRAHPTIQRIYAYELMPQNYSILQSINKVELLGKDFLECKNKFDRIIANPPFTKNQDIDHVKNMYDCLLDGGRLVSIMGTHWTFSTHKKETEFRKWLSNQDYEMIELSEGSFKESGTMVRSVIIVINK